MIKINTTRPKTPTISIAPLVDCVLLLLIFFLLTSTFSEQRAIQIKLPTAETAEKEAPETIEILVSGKGEIVFGNKKVELTELTGILQKEVVNKGKRPVLLIADKEVSLEKITGIIDNVRKTDLETVAIATRAEETVKPDEVEQNR